MRKIAFFFLVGSLVIIKNNTKSVVYTTTLFTLCYIELYLCIRLYQYDINKRI